MKMVLEKGKGVFEISEKAFALLIRDSSILEAFFESGITAYKKLEWIRDKIDPKLKSNLYAEASKLCSTTDHFQNEGIEIAPLLKAGERDGEHKKTGMYSLRLPLPRIYKPKDGPFKILSEKAGFDGEFYIKIDSHGIFYNLPLYRPGLGLDPVQLDNEVADILFDWYNTYSAVFLGYSLSLEIKKDYCNISRKAKMQQLKEVQGLPYPWLFVEDKEDIKMRVNGNDLVDQKNNRYLIEDKKSKEKYYFSIVENEKMSKVRELENNKKLLMKYFEIREVPCSAIWDLEITAQGKLPICNFNEEKGELTTCIEFYQGYASEISISLDKKIAKKIKLEDDCELMWCKKSDTAVTPEEKANIKFEPPEEGNMYKLKRMHLDKPHDTQFLRATRKGHGTLRIHFTLSEKKKIPPSMILCKETLCGCEGCCQ